MDPRMKYKFSLGGSLTPVVKTLIIINVSVFALINIARSKEILLYLGLIPASVWKERYVWQLITYMFVHVDFWHVLFNMLGLWWFGCDIERSFGSKHFFRYYLFTGVGAGILALFIGWGSTIPTIGASGAIFGILLAYAILFPNRLIYLYFIFPIKAKWMVLGFALIELFALLGTGGSPVSHSAHLGGIIFGLIWFGYYLKVFKLEKFREVFFRKRSKLKMRVIGNEEEKNNDHFDNDKRETIH